MSTVKGYIIKKEKRGKDILFDGIIYTNYDMVESILNRLSDEWYIEEIKAND
jgi:hypothetical protein